MLNGPLDTKAGEWICTSCGLVVGDRIILETQEWRTFEKDDKGKDNKGDPNRVGGPADLLGDLRLSTVIGADDEKSTLAQTHNRAVSAAGRSLMDAFDQINRLGMRLSLTTAVTDHAKMIYQKVDESKALKGRGIAVVVVACVFIACRQNGIPRTIRELCNISATSRRDVGRAFNKIKQLKIYKNTGAKKKRVAPLTSSFMERFCGLLKLPRDVTNAAMYTADQVAKLAIGAGKSPGTIAGGIIYLVTQLHPVEKRTTHEIAVVAHMAPSTIKQAYKLVYDQRTSILPPNFASKSVVEQLPYA